MRPSPRMRISVWAATILIVAGLLALVLFLPVVAALIFVGGVSFVAIAIAKAKGKMKGLLFFLKEILFGW